METESPVTIKDGYLYAGTFKVCRVNGQTLEFYDHNRERQRERGGTGVERVSLLQIVRAIAQVGVDSVDSCAI